MRVPVRDYGITIREKINIITAITVGEVNLDCAFVVKGEETGYIAVDKENTYLITGNCATFLVSKEVVHALESEDVGEIILTDQGNVFAVTGKGETLLIVSQGTIAGANEIGRYFVTTGPNSLWVRNGNNQIGTKRGGINWKRKGIPSESQLRKAVSTLHFMAKWLVMIVNALLLVT